MLSSCADGEGLTIPNPLWPLGGISWPYSSLLKLPHRLYHSVFSHEAVSVLKPNYYNNMHCLQACCIHTLASIAKTCWNNFAILEESLPICKPTCAECTQPPTYQKYLKIARRSLLWLRNLKLSCPLLRSSELNTGERLHGKSTGCIEYLWWRRGERILWKYGYRYGCQSTSGTHFSSHSMVSEHKLTTTFEREYKTKRKQRNGSIPPSLHL